MRLPGWKGICGMGAGALMLFAVTTYAAINEELTFYGTLNNTSSSPQTGTYDMVFRFYDAPTGGTLLDTSTHTAGNGNPVTVTDGEFSVQLGSGAGNALDGVDFNTDTIYIGLTVGADSEMTPRKRLTAAGYSFNSDTLDGYDSSEFFRTNATNTASSSSATTLFTVRQNGTGDILNLLDGGTEVFTVTDGGLVGIGTSSPNRTLTIAGDMELTGALYDSTATSGTNGFVLQSTGSGVVWVATSTLNITGGSGLFTDAGPTTYLTATADSLAIGTTTLLDRSVVDVNYRISNFTAGTGFNSVFFNDDGTKMYTVEEYAYNDATDGFVRTYDLSVAYDVNTAVPNNELLDIRPVIAANDAEFNDDGTKLFIFDLDSITLYGYDLGTPYDVSTGVYNDELYRPATNRYNYYGFTFNASGTKVYFADRSQDQIWAHELAVAYDITTASSTNESFDTTTQNNEMRDVAFNATGSKMYSFDEDGAVVAYDLGTPYDVSSAVYNGESFSWSTNGVDNSFFFHPAGTRFYVAHIYNDQVVGFDMSTPWDVSTATTTNQIFSTAHSDTFIRSIQFVASGTRMYLAGNQRDTVALFNLSTPFDLSTTEFGHSEFVLAEQTGHPFSYNLSDAFIHPAGTKLYVLDVFGLGDVVYAYDLSTAYEPDTAVYSGESFATNGIDGAMVDFNIFNGGTEMIMLGGVTDTIYHLTLSTPYDISTATTSGDTLAVGAYESSPVDVEFNSDGAELYVYGLTGDNFVIYSLSTPYDISTATFVEESDSVLSLNAGFYSFSFADTDVTLIASGDNPDATFSFSFVTEPDTLGVAGGLLALFDGGISFGGTQFLAASTTLESIHIGQLAGANTINGADNNVFVGYEAGLNSSSTLHDQNTFVGYQSGRNIGTAAAGEGVYLGYRSGYQNTGQGGIYGSSFAGYNNSGDYVTLIGYEAGYNNTSDFSSIFGFRAGYTNIGDYAFLAGNRAGASNSGLYTIGLGSSTAEFNTGDHLVALGTYAAQNNTGTNTISIGQYTGQNNSGDNNIFLGRYAGANNAGDSNVINGHDAGRYLSGTDNVIIGAEAMHGGGVGAFTGNNNVALGYGAGRNATTGASNNILIGYQAADNLTTGDNNIVIGYDIDLPTNTATGTLTIGNLIYGTGLDGTGTTVSTGNIGIGTSTPTAQFHTTGSVRLSNFGAGTLTTDASGNVSVSSDVRLKDVIDTYDGGLEAILGIKPIVYNWTAASGFETLTDYIGFSAQNIQEFIPGAVGEDPRGFLTLSDRGILATVVNAVQEVWAEVNAQSVVLTDNDEELGDIESRIESVNNELHNLTALDKQTNSETDAFQPISTTTIFSATSSESNLHTVTVTSTPTSSTINIES